MLDNKADIMSLPESRCGYTLTIEDSPHDDSSSRRGKSPFRDVCCWRETWKNHDYCIWHAKVDNKPVQELFKSRTAHPERLDGVYLKGANIGPYISFEDCTIHYSNLDHANLQHANLSGVEGHYTSFHNCELSWTILTGSLLIKCDFTGANMQLISAKEASLTDCNLSRAIVTGDFRHADIWDCDLSKSEKGGLDFRGARIIGTDFSDSLLYGTKHSFVDGSFNDYSRCDIGGGDFSFSSMDNCEFEDATIRGCTFYGTDLEESDFLEASIVDSDFRGADLYGCLFDNVHLDGSTKFGNHYQSTSRPSINVSKFIELNEMWEHSVGAMGGEDTEELLEKRAWTHHTLQKVSRRNSLVGQARQFFLRRKETQREIASLSGKLTNPEWLISSTSKYVMGYGEKPSYPIYWSIFVIFSFSALYTAFGKIDGTLPDGILVNNTITEYITNLYFSSATFVAFGIGKLQPSTWETILLTVIESFLGILLVSLFIFVLGRRSTW